MVALGSISAWYLTRLRFTSNQAKNDALFQKWMKSIAKTLNVTINVNGQDAARDAQGNKIDQKVLYMPNHLSYADSIVLGNSIRASFVAAEDVAKWPLIGKIAELRNTVFIEQVKGKLSDEEKQAVVERVCDKIKGSIDAGNNVAIFPEGTMSDGSQVLKFRPSAMSLLFQENANILAQPITIEIAKVNGQDVPKGQPHPLRDNFAWYCVDKKSGKMNKPLLKHVWDIAKSKSIEINVNLLAPLKAKDFDSHLDLAQAARESIINGLNARDGIVQATAAPAKPTM
jgi:1-acyl-sn-glycerol-3-phosphate acyltransferase